MLAGTLRVARRIVESSQKACDGCLPCEKARIASPPSGLEIITPLVPFRWISRSLLVTGG